MTETKVQRTLRELAEIGATVVNKGAAFEVRYKDEHILTSDLGSVNIQLLQSDLSRQGARRLSGRDWETVSFHPFR